MFSSLKSTFVVDVRGNSVLRTARTMPDVPLEVLPVALLGETERVDTGVDVEGDEVDGLALLPPASPAKRGGSAGAAVEVLLLFPLPLPTGDLLGTGGGCLGVDDPEEVEG